MILPTIVAISRDVITAVPDLAARGDARARGDALGDDHQVVLPYAGSGIVGAVILGLGRALGETMAVTMVIGNRPQLPTRLFDSVADDRVADRDDVQRGGASGSRRPR